jgi:hypothetical protein
VHLNADHLRSFDLDAISRFERDISTALVVVRRWKNSFAPINRIPLDILCLIPTHLSSQKDRFHASFVCRHWRRVFIQHAALWSQLKLTNQEDYVTTLLERAKGSALDVVAIRGAPLGTVTLLSPHTRQIRHLRFPYNDWTDILTFSEVNSGPLPLLRTLDICLAQPNDPFATLNPPSLPLFSGAVNLEEFAFHSEYSRLLNRFAFPNITTFKLTTSPALEFSALDLLGFLQASPTLQMVKVEVHGRLMPGDIPQDMVVVLPNVKTFSLLAKAKGWHVYHLATLVSCPGAKYTSLMQEVCDYDMAPGQEIFPDPASWEAIVRQYSQDPVEQVTLVIQDNPLAAYSLTFRSPDATVIRLGFKVFNLATDEEELDLTWAEMHLEIFSQACSTIRGSSLPHLKCLCVQDWTRTLGANRVLPMEELFMFLGPLDELIIDGCDLQAFLTPFFDLPEFRSFGRVFPHVKTLTILEGRMFDKQLCFDAIVELAKSQYEQEKPFEHVEVLASEIPVGTAERLREWAGAAHCGQI